MSSDMELPIIISLPMSPQKNTTACDDIEFYKER